MQVKDNFQEIFFLKGSFYKVLQLFFSTGAYAFLNLQKNNLFLPCASFFIKGEIKRLAVLTARHLAGL